MSAKTGKAGVKARPEAKLPVSVVVLIRNEEANLPGCLAMLGWAAEVVVVDSGSTDRGPALARKAGAKVYARAWTGYVDQRNFALSKCRQPWILSVDADERVAPDLVRAVRALLAGAPEKRGYRVRFVSNYFGRWLRYGGVYPDEHLNFFRREGARYGGTKGDVHERPDIADPGRLAGHITHNAYPSMELALEKLDRYTTLEAAGRLGAGARFSQAGALVRAVHRVAKNYLWKRGWGDGVQGLLYAFLGGYYNFCFRLKIWEARRREEAGRP
ncbi:MAG TPA: glycosyltransferase family 2 protein [bacterium]|jgi:glycosyltransferase involved in cell wall biosynthesis|nr:glycosyltransferase family 2 protein [bacterium]